MRPTALIIHPGSLGDVLLSLPAIRRIRCLDCIEETGLLARMELGSLLRTCGEVEKVFALEGEGLAGLLAGPDAVMPALRRWLGRCELAVCWLRDPEDRLASSLRGLGVKRLLIRSPGESGNPTAHQSERFVQTLTERLPETLAGVGSSVPSDTPLRIPESIVVEPRLHLSRLGIDSGIVSFKRLIALHPGSGSPHKCASPALFGMLVDRLTQREWTPVLVGGPADGEVVTRVSRACSSPPPILQGLDLPLMAGVLARAALFVGHDSGLTHLAAALGVPTVAMFGPTDVRRWGPRGHNVDIVTGAPCRCRGWEEIRSCREKPCLAVPSGRLLHAVEQALKESESAPCHGMLDVLN